MNQQGKESGAASEGRRRGPATSYMTTSGYLVTMGSVFSSAALSVLVGQSSQMTLWLMFFIGFVVILSGLLWGRSR